ncbi:MAG TPA: arginine deiminase family protein [Candidatus Sulfotelmatobacter sp.]|nr:arginine deiminase family protein [Candidatus Sulfotelmatobacter sp.]
MRTFGAQSMVAPLRRVLVKRPGAAFWRAFKDPALGFRHPVDLARARREHEALVALLADLGVEVEVLEAESGSADDIYPFDPLLVADRGTIALRSGRPSRRSETTVLAAWAAAHDIPALGRIQAPGTADGGDTFWLRPDLLCVGRSLRTNTAGARQLAALAAETDSETRVFDLPYWRGPRELLHLLSVISPVADDLAVVFEPLLPVGLWELLHDLGVRTIAVPEAEFTTLGCNVLAVRPGVLVAADGNPVTRRALEAAGCEVHGFAAREIGLNGGGGPTCLTRPILRG